MFDPHATACVAPLDPPSLIEPPSLAAIARALSDPEAVLVTAAAEFEVEGPAPDIVVGVWCLGGGVEERKERGLRFVGAFFGCVVGERGEGEERRG